MLTKHNKIFRGIKEGEIEAHRKASDLLNMGNNPTDEIIKMLLELHAACTTNNATDLIAASKVFKKFDIYNVLEEY